jgi:hypothetical protein
VACYFYIIAREEVSAVKDTIGVKRFAASEAVFGSASRGTSDHLSDRDILIVDDNVALLGARTKQLELDGWSVAPYTFAKLDALSAKGALFIQHLKLEASITRDRQGRLRALLNAFQPRPDYGQELSGNSDLANLASAVPRTARGPLLAADILYVAVRNFGVLWLAQRKRFHFAYDEILEALCEEQLLNRGAIGALSKLRFLKCLYRGNERETGGHAFRFVNEALGWLPRDYFPRQAIFVPAAGILSCEAPSKDAAAYLVLRDLERRLIALESVGKLPRASSELEKLSRWIANPRVYSSLSAVLAPALRAELARRAATAVPIETTTTNATERQVRVLR